MSRLSLEKDEAGVHVTLTHPMPALTATAEGEAFRLTFDVGGDSATLILTPAALAALGLQCLALMPSLAPEHPVDSTAEAFRQPARLLLQLADRSLQALLRECQSDILIDFLWYMKDGELLRRLLGNLSARAAAMLMEDLDKRWRGRNPDTAADPQARVGRHAILSILETTHRLMNEGQIPDVRRDGSDFLTQEEVNALLQGVTK